MDHHGHGNLVPYDQLKDDENGIRLENIRIRLTSTTNTTDDIGAIHSLLWTFPTPMTFFATVLTKLVLVVSKSTVKRGKFSKLVSFMVIFAFRSGRSLNH